MWAKLSIIFFIAQNLSFPIMVIVQLFKLMWNKKNASIYSDQKKTRDRIQFVQLGAFHNLCPQFCGKLPKQHFLRIIFPLNP